MATTQSAAPSTRSPDAATQRLLAQINAGPASSLDAMEPPALRQAMKRGRAHLAPATVDIFSTTDMTAQTATGNIALRVYRPSAGVLPALIYFPGGGWVLGDLDTHDALCRILANDSRCVVVSVDYRKAPENPFPAAVHDAIATLRWVLAHAAELTIDAAHLAVGGDSAGATLATVAAMAIHAADGIRFAWQLLLYPIVARPGSTGSYASHGRGFSLTADAMRWFFEQYAPHPAGSHVPEWWLTPSLAPGFDGLPATLVIVAGCDPLRDEGIAYAARLDAAGISTELSEYADQIHGFANTGAEFPRSAEVRSEIAAKLRRALGT